MPSTPALPPERQTERIAPTALGQAEILADAVVHGIALTASAVAGIWLLGALDPAAGTHVRAMVTVYVAAMAAMFAASALYHTARPGRLKQIARRVDHALIFAAIAGTYTPLLALRLTAPFGDMLCLSAWLIAGIGIALKIAAPRRAEKPGTALYLALAWAGLAVAIPLGEALQPLTSGLIIGGCLIYTAGASAYRARHFRYQTVLWHASVLVAASVHFTAMAVEFTPAVA